MIGCGGSKYLSTNATEITITMDGVPLEGANVSLVPIGEGDLAYGTTDANGLCVIQTLQGKAQAGTTLGDYTVTVRKSIGKANKTVDELVPAIYSSDKSPFKATVKSGKNTFSFDVDSKAK